MNTDLYLILQLLQTVVPDDITNKILLHLLSLAKTPCANCFKMAHIETATYRVSRACGFQYELKPQQTKAQEMAMCQIRITQYNISNGNRKALGAITNIKKYMRILDEDFKQRYTFLYC